MNEAPQNYSHFNAIFPQIHGFYSVGKFWQQTKVGKGDCSLYFHQAHITHFFKVISQDESDRRLGLCHVCFSTLLSQHQSVCTRLNLEIQERFLTESGGGSSNKSRGSAGAKFFKRSTDPFLIESKPWNGESLN